MDDLLHELEAMLDTLRAYGFSDRPVLDAMREVPRHLFIPDALRKAAYGDHPVPIGHEQTISQPYTVALMLRALELRKGMSVLEVGAGSGWNAALIKKLVGSGKVIAMEYVPELAEQAKKNLGKVGIDVAVIQGDGSLGHEAGAPYDRIIVTCACPMMPPPLVSQLKNDGIILAPVGSTYQVMVRGRKKDVSLETESLGSFSFVPLRGKHGFKS